MYVSEDVVIQSIIDAEGDQRVAKTEGRTVWRSHPRRSLLISRIRRYNKREEEVDLKALKILKSNQ